MIGDKHPAALGSKTREVFPEAWDLIGPMLEGVIDIVTETTGQVVSSRRLSLLSELTQALVDVDRLEDVTTVALAVLRRATRDFVSVDIARVAQVVGTGEQVVGDARGHVATVAIDDATGPDSCFL